MQYKIIEKNENPKESLIEKTGHVIKFTMYEAETVQKQNEKSLAEVLAKNNVEKAKMENIEHFHPFVKDLTDEQLLTAYMYYMSKDFVSKATDKINEFTTAAVEWHKEMEEIYAQLPELKETENGTEIEENNETESKGE